jgi:hypothetical protein
MMKYWKELNELETAIYDMKSIQAGLNILCETEQFTCYSPEGITQSHQTFVIDLNERFDTAMENLNQRFQDIWDVVRDDTGFVNDEEDTTPPWEEDLEAIDELENSHRWGKIVEGMMPKENDKSSDFKIEPLENGDFVVSDTMATQPTQKDTLVIQEIDGNLTTSYRPTTQQDLFDDQWNETYKRQSNGQ